MSRNGKSSDSQTMKTYSRRPERHRSQPIIILPTTNNEDDFQTDRLRRLGTSNENQINGNTLTDLISTSYDEEDRTTGTRGLGKRRQERAGDDTDSKKIKSQRGHIINDCHLPDAVYVKSKMEEFKNSLFNFYSSNRYNRITLPNWPLEDIERLISFLKAIGFVEKQIGRSIYYDLYQTDDWKISQVIDLLSKRINDNEINERTRERSQTTESTAASSFSSLGHFEEELCRSRAVSVAALSIDTSNAVTFRQRGPSSFRSALPSTRSRNSSIDGFDRDSPYLSVTSSSSTSPQPKQFFRTQEEVSESRTETESPTVQLGTVIRNFQFFVDSQSAISQPIPQAYRSHVNAAKSSLSLELSRQNSETLMPPMPVSLASLTEHENHLKEANISVEKNNDQDEVSTVKDDFEEDDCLPEMEDDAISKDLNHFESSSVSSNMMNPTAVRFGPSESKQSMEQHPIQIKDFAFTLSSPVHDDATSDDMTGQGLMSMIPGLKTEPSDEYKAPSNSVSFAPKPTTNIGMQPLNMKLSDDGKGVMSRSRIPRKVNTEPAFGSSSSFFCVNPKSPVAGITFNELTMNTPNQPCKIISGQDKDTDWGLSDCASTSICEKLRSIISSSHDDMNYPIHDHIATATLQRSHTTSEVYGIQNHRISSKALFHDSLGSRLSSLGGKTSLNSDIIPASTFQSAMVGEFNSSVYHNQSILNDQSFRSNAMKKQDTKLNDQKKTKSLQKWRRISMGFQRLSSRNRESNMSFVHEKSADESLVQHNLDDSLCSDHFNVETSLAFSPAVETKYHTSTNYKLKMNRRRLSRTVSRSSSVSDDSRNGCSPYKLANVGNIKAKATRVGCFSSIESHYDYNSRLNESNFRVQVIGGTYQYSFQDQYPVIAPASSSDDRVAGFHFSPTDGTLSIRLYDPRNKSESLIEFGNTWVWITAKPVGYLVLDRSVDDILNSSANRQLVGYFSMQHPSDWDYDNSPTRRDLHNYDRLITQGHSANTSFASCCPIDNQVQYHGSRSLESPHEFDDEDDDIMNISMDRSVIRDQDDISNIMETDFNSSPINPRTGGDSHKSNLINNITVAYHVLEFLLDFHEDPVHWESVFYLSKTWFLAAYRHYAAYKSSPYNADILSFDTWKKFMMKNYIGNLVGEGACKRVYCVRGEDRKLYAVSLINLKEMRERDMEDAITQELTISLICSSLNTLRICPNLVKIHTLFQAPYSPLSELWESETSLRDMSVDMLQRLSFRNSNVQWPKQNKGRKTYQYVRMELCTGGDIDNLLEKVKTLSIKSIRSYLFQIFFAVYSCRDQLTMRHYDLKLLNFLATSSASLIKSSHREVVQHSNNVDLDVGFGPYIYRLPLSTRQDDLVKLTDFGTSAIGAGGLGDPISVQQFTTLENTPIEFLLIGSDCRQAYSADTFCLGLTFLHLVIGHSAYEVHLQDVLCPKYLVNQLESIWMTSNPNDRYYVIHEVIKSLDVEDPDDVNNPCMVLYHTIYRYLVLFGASTDLITISDELYRNSPVWDTLVDALSLSVPKTGKISKTKTNSNHKRISKKSIALREECCKQFEQDVRRWSVLIGDHAMMKQCRDRLASLNDSPDAGMKLLERLIHFDPSRRCTMREAILNPIFDCFRVEESKHKAKCLSSTSNDENETYFVANQGRSTMPSKSVGFNLHQSSLSPNPSDHRVSFLHYYHHDKNGIDNLAML